MKGSIERSEGSIERHRALRMLLHGAQLFSLHFITTILTQLQFHFLMSVCWFKLNKSHEQSWQFLSKVSDSCPTHLKITDLFHSIMKFLADIIFQRNVILPIK